MNDNRLYLRLECEYKDVHPDCCVGKIEFRHAMTAYYFEGKRGSIDDPNRPIMMCEAHHELYVDYWRDMWSNVPGGGIL